MTLSSSLLFLLLQDTAGSIRYAKGAGGYDDGRE